MHVSALTLSHFRSHRHAALALDARPVAIFGPNGSGKTNLIEAVSLLSPGRGLRRAAADELMRRPQALGWRIGARIETREGARDIDVRAEAGQPRAVRIDDKAQPQAALGSVLRVLWLVPSMDRLWTEGAEGRRRFLDRLTMGFLPGHADASVAYEKAMRERNRLLRDQVRDPAWYAALEAQMERRGAEIAAGRRAALARVAAAQDAGATSFPSADLDICDPPGAAGFDAAALARFRDRDMAAGRTLLGPHRADLTAIYRDKGVAAAQCSTGEQKALLVSLVLATARALEVETGAPPVLLLDEVAAHLDAPRRAALYDEICALGAQAWLTGTGPELFDALGDRARRMEITEADGQSRIADA